MKKLIACLLLLITAVFSLYAVTDYTFRAGYSPAYSASMGFLPDMLSAEVDLMHPVRGEKITHGFGLNASFSTGNEQSLYRSLVGYTLNYGIDGFEFSMLAGAASGNTALIDKDKYKEGYNEENWIGFGLRVGGICYFDKAATYGVSFDTNLSLMTDFSHADSFEYQASATVSAICNFRGWSTEERKNYDRGGER